MNVDHSRRHRSVLDYARAKGFDAVLVGEPQNVYYLTGFWGEATVVVGQEGCSIIVPALEFERAKESSSGVEVIGSDRGADMARKIKERVEARKCLIDNVDVSTFNRLSSMVPPGLTADPDALMSSRIVKDEAEISFLVEGGKVMDKLYEVTADLLSPGTDERTVAAAVIDEMIRLKADPPAYASTLNPLIVASGANGSLPHAYTTERKMERGDFVVCDYVLRYGGYVVDATRTFAIESASDQMERSYDVVLDSQLAGIDATRPGVVAEEVDRAVRVPLAKAGMEELFVHGTGHGVGLDVHEAPFIRRGSPEVLREGMAVTVEPGVYVKGKYGVRIEDSLIVGAKPQILTHFPKSLVIV
ncbi:MAG TPA: Xaa-Pro peptidase family protein [Conexivisphaerales archaeon]|nr:Xaa-Pro peptidase family protein [Conexivisphaerales archaeon]